MPAPPCNTEWVPRGVHPVAARLVAVRVRSRLSCRHHIRKRDDAQTRRRGRNPLGRSASASSKRGWRNVLRSVDPSRCLYLAPEFPRISYLVRGSCLPLFLEEWVRGGNEPRTPILFIFVFLIKFPSQCNGSTSHGYFNKK